MPAQLRLGIDRMHCVPPAAAQPGQYEREQAVIVVDLGSPDAATSYDDLPTE